MRKLYFILHKKILVSALLIMLLLVLGSCGNRGIDDPTIIYEVTASQRVLDPWASAVLTTKTFGDVSGGRFHYEVIAGNGFLTGSTNKIEVVTAGTNAGLLKVRVSLSNASQLIDSKDVTLYVGGTWTTVGTAGFGTVARYQTLGVKSDGTPFVVIQQRDTTVYYGKSYHFDPTWKNMGGSYIGNVQHLLFDADVFTESTNIYLAYLNVSYAPYTGARGMSGQVRRFDGSSWVSETANFYYKGYASYGRAQAIDSIKVFKNRSGEICVLYRDLVNGSRPAFKIYRAGVWTNYGSDPYVTGAHVTAVDGVVDSSGTIYLAYINSWQQNKITVVKSTTSGWKTVGAGAFSSAAADVAIAVDSSGAPYVAYIDTEKNNRLLVMHYGVGGWQKLGGYLSAGQASMPRFVFDNNGVALLAYKNNGYGGRISAVKYFEGSWSQAGNALISKGEGDFLSLVVDRGSGTVYLGYRDNGYSGKTVVKQYK